jgi:hypothetical protein
MMSSTSIQSKLSARAKTNKIHTLSLSLTYIHSKAITIIELPFQC